MHCVSHEKTQEEEAMNYEIYINGRFIAYFEKCEVPIDHLLRKLREVALIGDGQIVVVEEDDDQITY